MTAFQAKFEQGSALHQRGKLADAERIYREILDQQPDHFGALHLLGVIAAQTKQTEYGAELIQKAIGINANDAAAHSNLGNALRELKRHEEAVASYDRAIALKPNYAEAYSNRAVALRDLKRPEEALASYDKAIALKPDYARAYNNRGVTLLELKRPEEAVASHDKAIALNPNYAEAYNNRGIAELELKRFEEALADHDKAIALEPNYGEAYFNQSLCFLLMGRFEQGLRQYEWRKRKNEPVIVRSYPQPLWLGEEKIEGKTLFIHWEQGFGDTIQFYRYAKLVEARGAKVIISVQQPLVRLLKRINPTIQIIGPNEGPINFDYHCPLLSLPFAVGTTLETVPAAHRYITADPELCVAWSTRLPQRTKPRIGVVWSGLADHNNDHNRSMGLEQLLPILSRDAQWICLQKEVRKQEVSILQQDSRIAYFGDELRDFSDTAALLDLVDLVVTVDTSVAHLAGAMGKPVWILLPYVPDWRWLLDRNDSPWYPSARLFRQQQMGNWAGVVEQAKNELWSFIG